MFAFLLRRIVQAALVMLVVASIAFLMFRFLGDPISNLLPEDATVEERADLREKMGLNDPFVVQYGRFIANAA